MPRQPGAGRPPKPVELKKLLGNPGKRALPEPVVHLPAIREVPEPPVMLGPKGQRFWNEAWSLGAPWLNPNLDTDTMVKVCQLTDEMQELHESYMKLGPLVAEKVVSASGRVALDDKGKPVVRIVANPAEKMLRRAEISWMRMLSELGFTPTARARLGLAQVKAESKLETLLANKAERMATKVVDGTAVSR